MIDRVSSNAAKNAHSNLELYNRVEVLEQQMSEIGSLVRACCLPTVTPRLDYVSFFLPFQITGLQQFMLQMDAKLDRLLIHHHPAPQARSPIIYRPVLNYYQDSLNEVNVCTNNVNSHNRKSTRDHSSTSYPTFYSKTCSGGDFAASPFPDNELPSAQAGTFHAVLISFF